MAGAASLLPRRALGSDMSLADRMDLLYSNQFNFDDDGRPRITVGLMQGKREVVLSAAGGLEALPSGDGGTAIVGGGRWRIRVDRSTPAEQRFASSWAGFPASDLRRVQRDAERWRGAASSTSSSTRSGRSSASLARSSTRAVCC